MPSRVTSMLGSWSMRRSPLSLLRQPQGRRQAKPRMTWLEFRQRPGARRVQFTAQAPGRPGQLQPWAAEADGI